MEARGNADIIDYGGKYLDFVSFRSVKLRGFSFAQFVDFGGK